MQTLIDWIRSVLIIYFLMMVMLYFSAGEAYKKFIRFFLGLVFALTLIAPLLGLLGKTDALRDGISYEQFRQDMEEAQLDFSHMEQTEAQVYRRHYASVLEKQFQQEADEKLLGIRQISVALDENYEPEQVCIYESLSGDGETFRQYLCEVYGFDEGQVVIK